jgi:hypothetical protein
MIPTSKYLLSVALFSLAAGCGLVKVNGKTVGSNPISTDGSTSESSSAGGATAATSGNDHDRFSIQNVKIGMPVEGRDGFVCAKAIADEDRHCVKFLDSRCSDLPANIGVLRYGEKAPLGCFFDYSSTASYLDGTLMQESSEVRAGVSGAKSRPERRGLTSLSTRGTQSKPSKIYRMEYTFEFDQLTEDSKLYKALAAKYGEPSYKNPPDQMKWKGDQTAVDATCAYLNCTMIIEDGHFEEVERRKQEEADSREQRKNAPAPPKL